jgi:leader peptidase (prepilin peptidase) / N-methyltransferase
VIALRVLAFAAFGLVIGSFLTVVIHRVPRHQSVAAPRSACPSCHTQIAARDNVPVFSYLLLRGRCRHCGTRISAEYPAVEALTAALFVSAGVAFPDVWVGGMMALFLSVVMASAAIDIHHRIIPNRVVYPSLLAFGAAIAALWAVGRPVSAVGALLGLLAYGGGLLVVALISPHGMGMGDVKLAGLIGLVLGGFGLSYVAVAAGLAILAGGLGAVALLAFAGASRKRAVPFGPYLAAGAIAAAFVAPQVAHWYTGYLR